MIDVNIKNVLYDEPRKRECASSAPLSRYRSRKRWAEAGGRVVF